MRVTRGLGVFLYLEPGVLLKFFNLALLNSQHSGCMASTVHCCRMAPGTKWEIFSYWHPPLELTLAWWAWGTGKAGQKKSHGLAIALAEIIAIGDISSSHLASYCQLTEKRCQLKIRQQTAWASVCVVYNISGQSFRTILFKSSQAPSTVSLYFGSYDL